MPVLPFDIRVIAVGKLRRSLFDAACQEYEQRLTRYVRFKMVEVRDVVGKMKDEGAALHEEGVGILKAKRHDGTLIVLDRSGAAYDSLGLARYLQNLAQSRNRKIDFVIGGPLGVNERIKESAFASLSLSQLTFPHELARALLLEQLYRACTILRNENYHK